MHYSIHAETFEFKENIYTKSSACYIHTKQVLYTASHKELPKLLKELNI